MNRRLPSLEENKPVSESRKIGFAIAALSLLIVISYCNSLDCSWHLDDIHSITQNPQLHLKNLSWESIKRTFFSAPGAPHDVYRPISGLSFALNYYFGGLEVQGYHLLNVFIHVVASVFLFLFVYHTLNLPTLAGKYAAQAFTIALLATAFWAIHPIQTQAITYIVQRMASLAGMFYIMSMYFYSKARTSEKRKRGHLFFLASLVSFLLSLGSKQNGVLLPLSLIFYEALLLQREGKTWLRKNIKRIVFFFSFMAILVVVYYGLMGRSVFSFLAGYEMRPFNLTERLLTEMRVVVLYITLLLYPIPSRLSIAHSMPVSTSLFSPLTTLASGLFIAVTIGTCVFLCKRYRVVPFCLFFFFLNHLMESTVVPLELVFEHRNYIPSMMFFVPMAMGLSLLVENYSFTPVTRYALGGFIVLLLVTLGHSTYVRNLTWKTETSLWTDAVQKAPAQFRPHHNLGLSFQEKGQLHEAISEFEKAIRSPVLNRKKETVVAYYQLGKAYHDMGEYEKAKDFYEKALEMDPNLSGALCHLAILYDAEGKTESTGAYLEQALRVAPKDPHVNFNLGLFYLKQGDMDKARPHFSIAKEEERLRSSAYLYMGMISKQKGQLGRAVICLKAAAGANPKDITPHLHLVEIYQAAGLENRSFEEGETVAAVLVREEALFYQTVNLILNKGGSKDVHLSARVIFPVLHDLLSRKSRKYDVYADYLKKVLDQEGKIE